MNYFLLIVAWLLYFTIHSVFAMRKVKDFFYSFGMPAHTYRLCYNLSSILLLLPILALTGNINTEYIITKSNLSKLLGLFVAGWGIVIAKIAFKSYDTRAFLGLGSLKPENEFKNDGLLKYVRHPLYAGTILIIIGYFFFDPTVRTLISACLLITYILVGIKFEEKKLIRSFGNKYLDYKRKTPMLIPRIWRKKIPD